MFVLTSLHCVLKVDGGWLSQPPLTRKYNKAVLSQASRLMPQINQSNTFI